MKKNGIGDEGAEALQQTLHFLFSTFKIIVLILLAAYFVSGTFVVKPEEEAFILRFGKIVGTTRDEQIIKSGHWHWAWPRPIDEVIRTPIKQSKTLEVEQFWHNEAELQAGKKHKTTPTNLNQTLTPGVDSYLLTGDNNIIHCKWSLTYLIADSVEFHLNHIDPENAIGSAFQNAISGIISTTPIHQILYGDLNELRQEIIKKTNFLVTSMGLGIVVKNVVCVRREPPQSVSSSFSAVTEAEQKKSQKIDKARGYRERVVQEASAKHTRIIAEAEGHRKRVVASVTADKDYFQRIHKEYRKAPETMLMTLHSDALTAVLGKAKGKYIIHSENEGQNQQLRLLIGNEADFLKKSD